MPPKSSTELDYRPSYMAAGLTSLGVLLLYLVTLAPSTAMWDTSEYITAAYTLGIPHPPGNPFFVLIGRVFTLLPLSSSIATRINILAALCSAASAGAWFLITERVLVSWFPERWQRITGGALAALIGATAFTVWNQSVVNEKVYTVSLAFFAIVAWLAVRWADEPVGPKADRILVLIAYLIGLGYANHPAGFLIAPAVIVMVIARRWENITRWPLLLACAGALVLGVTPFATQPIRAAHFPAINEGEPTACTEGPKLDCTFSKLTWERFKYNINREQYGKPPLSVRQAPLDAQIGMWAFYFKWQWFRNARNDDALKGFLQNALAAVFFLLGLLGGWVHWKRDRRSFWFFGPLIFTVTLGLIVYLNFKYGYSQAPELGQSVDREVRDRDYFYLWSFSAWSVWAALGLLWVWETVAATLGTDRVRVGTEIVDQPRRRSLQLTSPVLAFALIPLFANWTSASRATQTDTADFARDLLNSVEPYGVLVTVGDNDTFPLWYAQEVEGIRRDVTVVNLSLANTDWYLRQMQRRPIETFDPAAAPAIYRDRVWPKPTGRLMSFTDMELDSLRQYYVLNDKTTIRVGTFDVTLDPQQLGRPYIERADVAVLRIMKDQLGKRPIYFSRTVGSYADQFGLTSRLEGQGFGRALRERELQASDSIKSVPSMGWVNVKRSQALLFDTYHAESAARVRPRGWVDQPSEGILTTYGVMYYSLAQELQATQPTLAARAQVIAGAVFRNTTINFQPLPERAVSPPPSLIPR